MGTTKHGGLLILGSGSAGYTATVYAARANPQPVLITGTEKGGQLTTTTEAENWSDDPNDLTSPSLVEHMHEHATRFEAEVILNHINKVDPQNRPFRLNDDSDGCTCDTLIIATRVPVHCLSLSSEEAFKGRGVSACAICDGFFYRNQKVTVIDGGNTVVEGAPYLSNIASEVYPTHRRDGFRTEETLTKRLVGRVGNGNIILYANRTLEKATDDQIGVTGVRLRDTQDSDNIESLDVAGLLVVIGHSPNTVTFGGQLEPGNGYIKVQPGVHGNAAQTNIPGVSTAGNMMDHIYHQAITPASTGCIVVLGAECYLDGLTDAK